MSAERDVVVNGVRLGDVYRDRNGELWEVVSLCTEPTATVERVNPIGSPRRETHVIGCLSWVNKWKTRYVACEVSP